MKTVQIAGHNAVVGDNFDGLQWACVTLHRLTQQTTRIPAPFTVLESYDGWRWHSSEIPAYHHPFTGAEEHQRKSPGAFIHHYFVQPI